MNKQNNNHQAVGFIRAVGVLGLAAAIFNCTVGGGIFRLPTGAAAVAGSAAPLVYLICAAVMACVVLCFAEAGSRVAKTGGAYAYIETVFGRYAGFLAGVLLWMVGTTAAAGVASAMADAVATLIGLPSSRIAIIVCAFAFLAAVNVRGVEHGTRLIMIISVAKLLPLLVFIGVGVFFITPSNLVIAQMPPAADLARAAIILIFAFSGVESALLPSGEVRDPARTVPRAIAIAMIGVTLLYLAVHLVAQGVLGAQLANATVAPLAVAAGQFLGTPGYLLLLIGASISMLGYLSGISLALPRALWKFAQEGFLPSPLATVHPRFHTPHIAVIVHCSVLCVLASFNSFEQLAVISNLAALLLYIGVAIATILLRRRGIQLDGHAPFRVPGGVLIPLLTLVLIVWLLTSITSEEWTAMLITVVTASVLFVVTQYRRLRHHNA